MSNEYVALEDYRRVTDENARLRRERDLLRGRVHTLTVERMMEAQRGTNTGSDEERHLDGGGRADLLDGCAQEAPARGYHRVSCGREGARPGWASST